MSCATPAFRAEQRVVRDTCLLRTCAGAPHVKCDCSLIVVNNCLSKSQLAEFVAAADVVSRFGGTTAFGGAKPRSEVCYTRDGKPYVYSRRAQPTVTFPAHVEHIVPTLLRAVQRLLPDNRYTEIDTAVDIAYDATFERGGSIGAHSDDENPAWGLVVILSVGQARWLRLRRSRDGAFVNVRMAHNSLVAMYGAHFQQHHTHQVDKLSAHETVGLRLSLNIRFVEK
jgi:alkylated DNA repair dioxygenase AlkB